MTFQKSYLLSAKSNNSKKPDKAQIIITNPLKKDIFVNAINLVCDIYFSLYGKCEIKINGNPEFTPEDGAFKLRKEIAIPLEDQILQRGKSIEISIWNPTNDDLVELSVQAIISELKGNLVLSGQAIDDNTMLRGISGGAGDEFDTHDIFPYQIYRDETKEFLINTKGRKNMLLTMSSSNVLAPQIISDNFTSDSKPDPLFFKINSDADDSPDTQTDVHGSYVSPGTIRIPNDDAFLTPQTETEWYYVTEYRNILRDVTLTDNTILDDVTFDKFVDEYLLIDGQGTEDKETRFNFNSGSFSQDVTSDSMAFIKTRTTKYQRTRTVKFSGSFFSATDPVRKNVITDWTAYAPVSTSHGYSSATVTLRCNIKFEIEVSDDVNFAVFRKIRDVDSNGMITLNYSERYMRIKRIVTGERLIVNYGSSYGSFSADLSYPDITSDYTATNLIDLQSHGGTASLSFWLKGVNEQWFELLKSEELGAVTQGDKQLVRHNIDGIPPSQSRFKAVLQVVGSLKTGVTIDLVA